MDVPLDAMEIDCSGGTVLPGLIDTHLHFAIGLGDNYVEKFENSDDVQLALGCSMLAQERITNLDECFKHDA